MALHVAGAPMQCGDRFTLTDSAHRPTFENVNPYDFGLTEEEWYIRRLFRDSTAYLSGCNDPNAADYDSTAIDHDPNACHFLSSRCQTQADTNAAAAIKSDAEIGADVKDTLVNMVAGTLNHELRQHQQPPTSSATAHDAEAMLLVESMLIDASCVVDANLDDIPRLVSLLGAPADRVRMVGTAISVDGSWQCSRATTTPGLDSSVKVCFEVAGRRLAGQ